MTDGVSVRRNVTVASLSLFSLIQFFFPGVFAYFLDFSLLFILFSNLSFFFLLFIFFLNLIISCFLFVVMSCVHFFFLFQSGVNSMLFFSFLAYYFLTRFLFAFIFSLYFFPLVPLEKPRLRTFRLAIR